MMEFDYIDDEDRTRPAGEVKEGTVVIYGAPFTLDELASIKNAAIDLNVAFEEICLAIVSAMVPTLEALEALQVIIPEPKKIKEKPSSQNHSWDKKALRGKPWR